MHAHLRAKLGNGLTETNNTEKNLNREFLSTSKQIIVKDAGKPGEEGEWAKGVRGMREREENAIARIKQRLL